MAGSTGPNARMEKLTSNLKTECPEGQRRNKATGACEDIMKETVEAEVITTGQSPSTLKKGELTDWEKKHGKLSARDQKIADALSQANVEQLNNK